MKEATDGNKTSRQNSLKHCLVIYPNARSYFHLLSRALRAVYVTSLHVK